MSVCLILKKELRQYIYSPIAYILAGVFHAIIGFFFYNSLVSYSLRVIEMSGSGLPAEVFTPTTGIMQPIFRSMGTVFLLLIPMITMRLIAEEKRARTMELLMTSPVSPISILLGKFFAAFTIYAAIILSTVYMPVFLDILSTVNWGHVVVAYLGLLLVGGAMLAVGVLGSAVTDKQVVSAVLSIGILVIFWFVGGGIGAASLRVAEFMREVSLFVPFQHMIEGLLDLRDVASLLSFVVVFLYVSLRIMESERW